MTKKKEEAAPVPTVTKTLVCIAKVKTMDSKKLMPEFAEVADDGELQLGKGTVVFDVKATVGHVYVVQASQWGATGETKTIQPSTFGWSRVWPDREQRLAWEAAADMAQARLDQEKARARAEKSTALREAVRPLAKAYSNLISSADRRAFLTMVVEEVCNPRNAKET